MLALTVFLALLLSAFSQNVELKEYEIKAAFIYNIIMFSTWEDATFKAADDPFVIGVLEHDPFGNFIDELVRGEMVQGHPIVIKRVDRNATADVHVLFISDRVEIDILKFMENINVPLTIGDQPGFAEKGGTIRLFTENNKMRFEVNLKVLEKSQVSLSSKLLRLAKICCND